MSVHLLVVDVGTTALRAAVVDGDLGIVDIEQRSHPPSSPFDGLVEFDAAALAEVTLDACRTVVERTGVAVDAVGITNQRASTVLWDRSTGEPVAPGLGWQDLRTVTECIVANAEHDLSIAPNQSITKLSWLLSETDGLAGRDLCFGTIDSWIAWTLTDGAVHVSDATNTSTTTTGMRTADGSDWSDERLDLFGIDRAILPRVVDSAGVIAPATALDGAPPLAALVGDQQASLVGQGCVRPGVAKITLGTGGMLDLVTGADPPTVVRRSPAGTYALPTWSIGGELTWGAEAIMLSAGTNVEWLRDDLGLIETVDDSHEVAQRCDSSEGVVFVPAPIGIGTPRWDYGARSALVGLTRGTERSHVVRAVLEGVAHRAADLVEAAAADTGVELSALRLDGGMSRNPTVVRALADATGLRVEVSPTVEGTTRGAAFLAGLGIGNWSDVSAAAELWEPVEVVEPDPEHDREASRARWADALDRSVRWHPELSELEL
ncbi:FGGY family carbohydrate kinase [Ilumatobacter sp.]|uniref:FGGY family carbohydrate kinase n=1 Tax=Ilumatobacter sp. TaxID=1967498 RepID=UPI003B520CA7